jgi:hypothetical protein
VAAGYGERVTTARGRLPYPRLLPLIALAVIAGLVVAGFLGASTGAAWGGLAVLALLYAAWRVYRTRSRLDWIVLSALIVVVVGSVSFILWIYLADIPVGS